MCTGTVKMDWCAEADDCACGGTSINCANQTDRVFLRGDSTGESFTPSFTYHGYRYVQVEGLLAPPTNTTLTAMFVHTAVTPTSKIHFNSSFEILNEIQTAIEYTSGARFPTESHTRGCYWIPCQWHSSRVSTASYRYHCKSRPNTEGRCQTTTRIQAIVQHERSVGGLEIRR
jgi:hypothetical protein